jgi:hypothetical protein
MINTAVLRQAGSRLGGAVIEKELPKLKSEIQTHL